MEILVGIICGLALSLFFGFGPAFFGLIQNSINYGFRKGVAFEVGVNSSDILIVSLMLTLLKNVEMTSIVRNPYVAVIGGSAVIALGVMSLLRKPARREGTKLVFDKVPRGRELAVQGFALNLFNPTVWLYWISLVTFLSAEMGLTAGERWAFFISLLLTELGVGILKCRLASLLQKVMSDSLMRLISRGVGAVLIGVGVFLIVSMIVYRSHPELQKPESSEGAAQLIQRFHNTITHDSNARRGDTLYLK
ncbi:MAG: LysE family transporter [Bacteroidales bacterium]|nr:LysE family transporter [Bacteroidales bacterium]